MKEQFKDINFRRGSMALILKADEIIREYQSRGFVLTLRQLYYQFVSRDYIDNSLSEYKRLGKVVNDARLAGMLDWSAIEDRTRNLKRFSSWTDAEDMMNAASSSYAEDPWIVQNFRPEVWIEKDALVGVIQRVCREYSLPYFACRGYASQSEIYDAGKRFARMDRYIPVILHLGDHDPSGLDMTRDVQERLSMFAGKQVEVRRLALNMNQVEQYDPPPNPAKDTDARFQAYADEFGNESWELDALDPDVISDLIKDSVEEFINWDKWNNSKAIEAGQKEELMKTYRNWAKVAKFVRDLE